MKNMKKQVTGSVTDKQWAEITAQPVINRVAQRRKHAAERAAAIATLGMAPEDKTNPYCASTGELEAAAKRGCR